MRRPDPRQSGPLLLPTADPRGRTSGWRGDAAGSAACEQVPRARG